MMEFWRCAPPLTQLPSSESPRGFLCPLHAPPAEQNRGFRISEPYAGEWCVELSHEFRANAAECLKLSYEANSTGSQGYWVAMAQFWFQLAQHAEDREAIESVTVTVMSSADPVRRNSAMQQRQDPE